MTQQQIAYFKADNDYKLGLLNAGINRAHYERSDTAALQSASANLRNAESNAYNAASNRMNAFTNARNADTNYRNALTNAYNADTNRYSANISLFNAETQAQLARSKMMDAETNRSRMRNDYEINRAQVANTKRSNEIAFMNAQTNYQNAQANWYNAEWNRQVGIQNASTNKQNAETNWYNAVTDRGELGVSKDRVDAQNYKDEQTGFNQKVQGYTNAINTAANLYSSYWKGASDLVGSLAKLGMI